MALVNIIPTQQPPTSWSDGLNWSNPDPTNWRYWYALGAAINERANASSIYGEEALNTFPLDKGYAVHEYATRVSQGIALVSRRYVNIDSVEYSSEPNDHHYFIHSNINGEFFSADPATRFWMNIPTPSSPASAYRQFMRSAKRAIDKVRYLTGNNEMGLLTHIYGYGSGDSWVQATQDCDNSLAETTTSYGSVRIIYDALIHKNSYARIRREGDTFRIKKTRHGYDFGVVAFAFNDSEYFIHYYPPLWEEDYNPIVMYDLPAGEIVRLDFPPTDDMAIFKFDAYPKPPTPSEDETRRGILFYAPLLFVFDLAVNGGFNFRPE